MSEKKTSSEYKIIRKAEQRQEKINYKYFP